VSLSSWSAAKRFADGIRAAFPEDPDDPSDVAKEGRLAVTAGGTELDPALSLDRAEHLVKLLIAPNG
jgi:hypothetical protein